MLSREENRRLTEVTAGTVMGNLLRRFWIPVLLAADVRELNGDPVRLRVLGENLIVWRDAAGRLACFDEYCMHRGASLALAHCEGDGLRCIYHGWKFAADGAILETPNYSRSSIRDRFRAPVHATREAGGLVWTYLGDQGTEPPFPHYSFMDLPPSEIPIFHASVACNYAQVLEATIDPSHRLILHTGSLGSTYNKDSGGGLVRDISATSFSSDDLDPTCEVRDTTFGCDGLAILNAEVDGQPAKYVRIHTWVMPFAVLTSRQTVIFIVPIDDEHSLFFAIDAVRIPGDNERRDHITKRFAGAGDNYDQRRFRWDASHRWGQDRSRMRQGSFTGIEGVVPEDFAVLLSMGARADRTREHLVPADRMLTRVRQRLLAAAKDLQRGVGPVMLEPEDYMHLGGNGSLVASSENCFDAVAPNHARFSQRETTNDAAR
jgi:phenylpropionate dioxygenase-like ring-hydroxylating dioxygenase large terminal subunit